MEIEHASILVTLVLLSVAGFGVRAGFRLIGVPPALSLIALGMLLRALPENPLPEPWLASRPTLSYIAFVLLLLRAGMMISPQTVRRIVGPAILLGTIPVAAEFAVSMGLTRWLLFENGSICALASFMVAAVSQAVILPIMIRQREQRRSIQRMVPERIIGMTIVNAFIAQTGILAVLEILSPDVSGLSAAVAVALWLPVAIAGGVVLGSAVGFCLRLDWVLVQGHRLGLSDGGRFIAWIGALSAFLAAVGVYLVSHRWGLDSVVATLALGVALRRRVKPWLNQIESDLRGLWSIAEIVLFVNVGSYVDVTLLARGRVVAAALVIVIVALLARAAVAAVVAQGIVRSSGLSRGEERYIVLAQIPKATIQAVFGAMPLAVFTSRGQTEFISDAEAIVVLAAVAIVTTAPLGAVTLERWAKRLLETEDP